MSTKSVPFQMQIRKYKILEVVHPKKAISHTKYPSRTRLPYLAHEIPISHTNYPSRTRLPPSRIRFQGRSGWGFYCKWSKIDWMSMNEENSRASIRAREAEKAHGIRTFSKGWGAKKKGPNCIQIRVLLWCRKWDSNPHGGLAQRILSPPRLPIPSFRQAAISARSAHSVYFNIPARELQARRSVFHCFSPWRLCAILINRRVLRHQGRALYGDGSFAF